METLKTHTREHYTRTSYREHIEAKYGNLPIWDYLAYDQEGDLWFNGVRILDILNAPGGSDPVEIVDPEISEARARQFKGLAENVRVREGYEGKLGYFYATKAAGAAEIMAAAVKAGWQLETSSEQDLINIEWAHTNGFLPKDIEIICNGNKPRPERLRRFPESNARIVNPVTIVSESQQKLERPTYLEMIIRLKKKGLNITPIIDSMQELEYFIEQGVPMHVGLRLKAYDLVKNNTDVKHLVARHGFDEESIYEAAARISESKHLTLSTFHAMIGAATNIPTDKHVEAIMTTADIYYEIRKTSPELHRFNMGGGIRPFSSGYNHEAFLHKLFKGLKQKAAQHRDRVPDFDFEFGSLVAAEAGIAVMHVVDEKINGLEQDSTIIPWANVNYSFMRGIIDTILVGERYIVLAANNANNKGRLFRIGDPTCDHDGYLRTDDEPVQNTLTLPIGPDRSAKDTVLVVIAMQAYEEMLTGIDGIGHCFLFEAPDLVKVRLPDGRFYFLREDWKETGDVRKKLGFTKDFLGRFLGPQR